LEGIKEEGKNNGIKKKFLGLFGNHRVNPRNGINGSNPKVKWAALFLGFPKNKIKCGPFSCQGIGFKGGRKIKVAEKSV